MSGEIVIGGVGVGVIVAFVVQLAKRAGLPDGYAGWLNLALSVVFYALLLVTQQLPQTLPTVTNILSVIAYVAVTFGTGLASYKGLRKSEIFKS